MFIHDYQIIVNGPETLELLYDKQQQHVVAFDCYDYELFISIQFSTNKPIIRPHWRVITTIQDNVLAFDVVSEDKYFEEASY